LTLGQAAKYLKVSRTTIKKLVAHGNLEKKQIVAWAPWEIKKSDLDSDRIKRIIRTLHQTGKLDKGVASKKQLTLLTNI